MSTDIFNGFCLGAVVWRCNIWEKGKYDTGGIWAGNSFVRL